MIPLIRPTFPDVIKANEYFNKARASLQFTNFGALHTSLVQRLSIITNMHALPVTSGTTALEVALIVSGLKGKRVAVPDYTHSSTLLSVVRAGAEPIIIGSSTKDWVIDLEILESKVKEYDAIIVVSPFGHSVDVAKFDKFAHKNNKKIVYDFAGAWGFFPITEFPVCYSFHSTKNFGVGEGGMVCFDNALQWEEGRKLINFGTLSDRSIQNDLGFNGKLDEFRCALIHAQLDDKDQINDKIENKTSLAHFYRKELKVSSPSFEALSLCVFPGFDAKELESQGPEAEIIFKQYYPLLSQMPGLKCKRYIDKNTIRYFNNCVALPSDVSLAEAQTVVSFAKAYKLDTECNGK